MALKRSTVVKSTESKPLKKLLKADLVKMVSILNKEKAKLIDDLKSEKDARISLSKGSSALLKKQRKTLKAMVVEKSQQQDEIVNLQVETKRLKSVIFNIDKYRAKSWWVRMTEEFPSTIIDVP